MLTSLCVKRPLYLAAFFFHFDASSWLHFCYFAYSFPMCSDINHNWWLKKQHTNNRRYKTQATTKKKKKIFKKTMKQKTTTTIYLCPIIPKFVPTMMISLATFKGGMNGLKAEWRFRAKMYAVFVVLVFNCSHFFFPTSRYLVFFVYSFSSFSSCILKLSSFVGFKSCHRNVQAMARSPFLLLSFVYTKRTWFESNSAKATTKRNTKTKKKNSNISK